MDFYRSKRRKPRTFVLFVPFCNQVVKTLANAGFLEQRLGHCQWKCQKTGGLNYNPPQSDNYSAETRPLPLDKPTRSDVSIAWFQNHAP
jgi:hypothetical protein